MMKGPEYQYVQRAPSRSVTPLSQRSNACQMLFSWIHVVWLINCDDYDDDDEMKIVIYQLRCAEYICSDATKPQLADAPLPLPLASSPSAKQMKS